ncbi:hypothetical protein FJT64_013176 [Amphibalanus amphitrite]|uniref:Uncharacterized protein n=1 Tax=Amphibalanus amphitrite TaxID=1232801 RepID=A0A6A4VB40_AMPAM|nr:hypothetical protein FJT64_013176 [Amphibalanus amphitrite]
MPDIGSITFPAQMTTIPSQLRGAIIRVGPNTIILPAGVGDSELTELRSSRETVKRLSVSAADLPRLRGQLPEGLRFFNVRGPEVTEPRWPVWDEDDDLSVSLQGVAADTISPLADLGRTVTRLEIYDCTDHTAGSLEPLTRCTGLERLSVSAADLPRLRGQLPEGLRCLNVRGFDTTVSAASRPGSSSVRLQSADTALSDRAGCDEAEVACTVREWSVGISPGGGCRHHQSPGHGAGVTDYPTSHRW